MSKELKGNTMNEPYTRTGKLLNQPVKEGDLLTSEGPKGEPLWKKKKKLNEQGEEPKTLNETRCLY